MVYSFFGGLAKGVSCADKLATVVFKSPQTHTVTHAQVFHHVRGNVCGLLFRGKGKINKLSNEKSLQILSYMFPSRLVNWQIDIEI